MRNLQGYLESFTLSQTFCDEEGREVKFFQIPPDRGGFFHYLITRETQYTRMARLELARLEVKMLITNRIEFGPGANPFTMPNREGASPEKPLSLVKVLHMVAQ